MKTKLTLFAGVAVVLLSFTFRKDNKQSTVKHPTKQETGTNSGGFAMEDRNQWK